MAVTVPPTNPGAGAAAAGVRAPNAAGAHSVPAMFLATARARGERVALRHKHLGLWREVRWSEYADRVRRFALGLHALGLRHGDRVAVIGENAPEWVIADLGIQSAGGVTVGIYTTSSASQCRYVIAHSGAKFLVIEGEEQLDKWLAVRSETPSLERVIVWDLKGLRDFADPAVMRFDELLALGGATDAADPALFDGLVEAVGPDDPAMLIYTSGTTGPPKGAILLHGNLVWMPGALAEFDPELAGAADGDVLSFLPLCHIFERLISVLIPARVGNRVNFVESLETVPLNLREIAPAVGHGVPRIWEKLASAIRLRMADATRFKRLSFGLALRAGRAYADRRLSGRPVGRHLRLAFGAAHFLVFRKLKERLGLHRMRAAVTGAAPIAPDVLRFYHTIGLELTEGYGLTESTGVLTSTPRDRVRPGTVGVPLPGVEIRIAEDGEILARSPGVFAGYYEDPGSTAAALDADGWLHTGDVGELDEAGYLRIVDRKKDLIITAGGKNIAPQFIENRLKFSPYLTDAVVIGDRRPFLSALVVLDEDNVVKWARDRKVPFSTYAELSQRPEVVRLIRDEIDAVNRDLARVENVREFRILPKRLYEEDGEVTPTMKVKRAAIDRAYADLIEDMYGRT